MSFFARLRAPIARKLRLRLTLQPSVDILAHHIPGQAVALPNDAFELLTLSVDLSQIVIGELAPLLFDLAFRLSPISLDAVPVHCVASENPDAPRDVNVATCRTVPPVPMKIDLLRAAKSSHTCRGRLSSCMRGPIIQAGVLAIGGEGVV